MAALISEMLSKKQFDELQSTSILAICTYFPKHLFCDLNLWNVFVKLIHVFGGIWQYNVEIIKYKFLLSAVTVPFNSYLT